jgi:hypothetical protein
MGEALTKKGEMEGEKDKGNREEALDLLALCKFFLADRKTTEVIVST